MNEMQIYTGVRYATKEEINTYEWVDAFLSQFDANDFMQVVNAVSLYAIEGGRKNYQRVYRLVHKHGLHLLQISVPDLVTWYFIEPSYN